MRFPQQGYTFDGWYTILHARAGAKSVDGTVLKCDTVLTVVARRRTHLSAAAKTVAGNNLRFTGFNFPRDAQDTAHRNVRVFGEMILPMSQNLSLIEARW